MLKCHIVRQLLPSYTDGLLDEESHRDVEEHLETCTDCDTLATSMRLEIDDSRRVSAADGKEVKFLKRWKRRSVLTALGIALSFLVLIGVYLKLFYWGFPISETDVAVNGYTATQKNPEGEDELIFMLNFELAGGKALMMQTKYLDEDETDDGTRGVILTPRAVFVNPLDNMGATYRYGYHLGSVGSENNFRITVRYNDKKVVYDMREWSEDNSAFNYYAY
jgi:hypothetical protein